MPDRRTFLKHATATAGVIGLSGWPGLSLAAESTQSVLVFDAMGEIRDV